MKFDLMELPFNKLIGIALSDLPDYLLMLDEKPIHQNHIQSIHAGALYTLAEGTSGLFMLNQFSDSDAYLPVLRRSQVKYRKPAFGKIYGKGWLKETTIETIKTALTHKGTALFTVGSNLFNLENQLVMQCEFEWFVQKIMG